MHLGYKQRKQTDSQRGIRPTDSDDRNAIEGFHTR